METAILNVDEELQMYVMQLNVSQKKSVLSLIKSFINNKDETIPLNFVESSNGLKEAEATYQTGETISGKTEPDETNSWIEKPQTIEDYNKEIEEAEKRIEAGEFYTHEEAMAIINGWCK